MSSRRATMTSSSMRMESCFILWLPASAGLGLTTMNLSAGRSLLMVWICLRRSSGEWLSRLVGSRVMIQILPSRTVRTTVARSCSRRSGDLASDWSILMRRMMFEAALFSLLFTTPTYPNLPSRQLSSSSFWASGVWVSFLPFLSLDSGSLILWVTVELPASARENARQLLKSWRFSHQRRPPSPQWRLMAWVSLWRRRWWMWVRWWVRLGLEAQRGKSGWGGWWVSSGAMKQMSGMVARRVRRSVRVERQQEQSRITGFFYILYCWIDATDSHPYQARYYNTG